MSPKQDISLRPGARLKDGRFHQLDHQTWSRRSFLGRMGLAAIGGGTMLSGLSARTLASALGPNILSGLDPEKRLILVQLAGGNDGLNTLVPFKNEKYYELRPTLAIPPQDTIAITADLAFNKQVAGFMPIFEAGDLAIVNNVGYNEPNLSHFESTNIWMNGSASEQKGGWLGRYIENDSSLDPQAPDPLAIQIGDAGSFLFATDQGNYSASFARGADIRSANNLYDVHDVPDTTAGRKMAFVRDLVNKSSRYNERIVNAFNSVAEPQILTPNRLWESLDSVLRLMKGGLATQIYHVVLPGFDTHADQGVPHQLLLADLGEALNKMYLGLKDAGLWENTVIMTFSEFGRRMYENGSKGTDHGTLAPAFLAGGGVVGGLHGGTHDLDNVDDRRLQVDPIDFRSLYRTILSEFMGLGSADAAQVLGDGFESLSLFARPVDQEADSPALDALPSMVSWPNPAAGHATLEFVLPESSGFEIGLYDVAGKKVRTIATGRRAAGRHQLKIDLEGLPSGSYLYRMTAASGSASGKITVIG